MVLKNSYEKIVLILSLITLILVIYYLAKTYFKHDNILEKFSEKILYKDVKFRDCEIYFTKDKEGCDRDYAANDKDTCKYKFENWKELDKIGDGAIKKHKVYVDNKLNEGDYANVKEETRCFYKLGEDDDKSGDNIMVIDNNYYAYNDFYPFNIDNSICNTVVPIKTGISGKYFYEFILDKDNNLVDIKKVSINAQQNSFIVDSTFTISKFIEQYGNGLEYYNEKAFKIYKISKFPDLDVKVHKFTYNYLCYNTQIKNYSIINAKLQLNNFLALSSAEKLIQLPDIDTNITGIRWDDYKNSDSNIREDKKSAIIKALEDRKKVIQDEIDEKDSATSTALSIIKQKIIDNDVIGKYQLTTYYDSNKEKWNEAKFLNQFSVHNYKREYLTKSADAIIDTTIEDVTIRIKNNFKEGLKWFKVDGYYNDNIEHIRNKDQIRGLQLESGSNITKFKGLSELTDETLYANHDSTYTMWFTGYFYAHDAGHYIFGTKSDDASYVYLNDNLIVNNGGTHPMRERKSIFIYLNKREIYKLDIYFGENGGGDDLEFFWKKDVQGGGQKTYTSYFNGKTWIYHTVPAFTWFPFTDGDLAKPGNDIPLIGNTQYVDCIYSDLNNKILSGSSGDIYYEFKNTDFIYDVKVNRNIETSILVVGGGGGGGAFGGGGGGGTVLFSESKELAMNDSCIIKVGNGGNGAPIYNNGVNGNNGIDSSITINRISYVANGGGGGGTRNPQNIGVNGDKGGSGGGGSHSDEKGKQAMGGVSEKESYDDWKSYGNNGGKGRNGDGGGQPSHASGGGGGAGFRGEDAIQTTQQYRNFTSNGGGGDGGVGKNLISYFGSNVGEKGFFGGGGGGSTYHENGRVGWGSSYTGISDNIRQYGGGGDGGYWNGHGKPGMEATGGGGGGGGTKNDRSGRGGSGVVILRIKNTPSVKLAKCNYYIPPISQITPYLPKSDVMNSKISFEVRNSANPKSLFYSSYIYLKKGNYKFNFDIDTSKHKNLYTKSKIIIYNDKDKKTFISVYTDNMVTKKWVYIPDTKYYIINLCILYISGGKYDIPFSVKAMYTSGDKSNAIEFSKSELSINKYEGVTSSDSSNYKDMTGYIYIHDSGHIDRINNKADEYNNNFNNFLESYFLLNTSFGKVIDYFKLLGRRNNEKKSNINIQKIDKLIEFLNNIDLNGYLDKSNDNMNLSGDAKSIFAQNTILNINDYITFKQYKQADKNELKGADYTFDMLKHADRSIYIEVF